MKVVSWNVNGLRAVERKGDFDQFITTHNPDVFFLQEIKGNRDQFSDALNHPADYLTHYHSAEKKGYSGTGTWVKKTLIESAEVYEFFSGMPGKDKNWKDTEGRVSGVQLKIKGIFYRFIGIYFPNGGKSELAFEEKLIFYNDFLTYINHLKKQGEVCLWMGDVNCAHNEIDLARPKDNAGKVGFHPKERAWLDNVLAKGWLDLWRHHNPNKKDVYSWWHYYTGSRERNVGWRIDYAFAHQDNLSHVNSVNYLNQQMGSDHCPVQVEFST